jgi:hypothetical protein
MFYFPLSRSLTDIRVFFYLAVPTGFIHTILIYAMKISVVLIRDCDNIPFWFGLN